MALLEAASVGLAAAGCPDETTGLLEENKTAVFFDPADELSIYDCLGRLLSRREEGRKMAMEGQARLRKGYSVSGMLEQLLGIYRRVQQEHTCGVDGASADENVDGVQ